MKRVFLFGAWFLTISASLSAQTYAIFVNGGQFGNPNSNVNVQLYDPVLDSTLVIDTIQTQSAQDVLIQGDVAYVAAQDSIVRYDLSSRSRTHTAAFNGPSTYTLALDQNQLLVGNWFGATTDNLYIYDASNLNLIDSVTAVSEDAKSILIKNGFAFITQNLSTSGFQDTSGYVIRLDLNTLNITDTLSIANYSGDIGELIERPDGNGFYSLNSVSNTIGYFSFTSPFVSSNGAAGVDLKVGNSSQWARNRDTLYARMENGIGAIDLNSLSVIDTNFIDTVITAFAYDSLMNQFYVSQTDFFSFNLGKTYDRNGSILSRFAVGFSPEAADVYYAIPVNVSNPQLSTKTALELYPNPTSEICYIPNAKANDLIRVLDLSGKLVWENRIANQGQALDVSRLNRGSYIVMLLSEEGISTSKMIID